MPNTASAERRMRGSVRKHARNRATKAKLKTLARDYESVLAAGDQAKAAAALRAASSALDKAAKSGAIHRATANRKKSRLAVRLAKAAKPAAPAAPAPAPAPAATA